jgi:hypothetical protein
MITAATPPSDDSPTVTPDTAPTWTAAEMSDMRFSTTPWDVPWLRHLRKKYGEAKYTAMMQAINHEDVARIKLDQIAATCVEIGDDLDVLNERLTEAPQRTTTSAALIGGLVIVAFVAGTLAALWWHP